MSLIIAYGEPMLQRTSRVIAYQLHDSGTERPVLAQLPAKDYAHHQRLALGGQVKNRGRGWTFWCCHLATKAKINSCAMIMSQWQNLQLCAHPVDKCCIL